MAQIVDSEHTEDPCRALIPDIVDLGAWHRYCTVLSVFRLYGKSILNKH